MNNTENDKRDESMDSQVSKDTKREGTSMCENTTIERPNHENALARILVSGLSLLCCNPNDGRGELGFIDEHHDPLVMNIYRNEGCGDLFWSSGDLGFSMEKVGITINTTKPAMCRKYENGEADDESYSHMPDLAKLHNVKKFEKKQTVAAALSARVDIRDATFYTYKMSENKAFLREKKDPSTPGKIKEYKKIGRILGADIFSEEAIQIEIKYKEDGRDTKTYNVPPLDPEAKYTIVLMTRTHNEGSGHIKFIYDKILKKPPGHPEYDYEFYPEEPLWDYCSLFEKATQFACESTGGGYGPLPVFPPDA